MLPSETAAAVQRLFRKYANPKLPKNEQVLEDYLAEWRGMAQEFAAEVWDEAATRHWRSNKYATPNPGDMYDTCLRVRSEMRASASGGAFKEQRESEHEKWQRWEVEALTSQQHTAAWAEEQDDATLDALRDSWVAAGPGRRDFFTAVRQDRRDAFDMNRAATVNVADRLLSGPEIRAEPMLLGILRSWANRE